ncbi:hypothetical protein CRG98_033880 [Punica granatum]|uniref:Uncharacterized protein n=1 Tax=Punica granatum TaxID=22663 RepID=A0A2I0IP64_PUNGR|nr:hypothetical protein CRG98_033880 [Punica granatum]
MQADVPSHSEAGLCRPPFFPRLAEKAAKESNGIWTQRTNPRLRSSARRIKCSPSRARNLTTLSGQRHGRGPTDSELEIRRAPPPGGEKSRSEPRESSGRKAERFSGGRGSTFAGGEAVSRREREVCRLGGETKKRRERTVEEKRRENA